MGTVSWTVYLSKCTYVHKRKGAITNQSFQQEDFYTSGEINLNTTVYFDGLVQTDKWFRASFYLFIFLLVLSIVGQLATVK